MLKIKFGFYFFMIKHFKHLRLTIKNIKLKLFYYYFIKIII